jgi:hypothetical protein
MDTTIRNIDEQSYREAHARAVLEGRTVGDVVNEALGSYLKRTVPKGKRSLAEGYVPNASLTATKDSAVRSTSCIRKPGVIVLDSSFLIAFHNQRDSQHEAARGAVFRCLCGCGAFVRLAEEYVLEFRRCGNRCDCTNTCGRPGADLRRRIPKDERATA